MKGNDYLLLVEDMEDDALLMRRHLKKLGIKNIKLAKDGQEALEILFDLISDLPLAVVLDLKLPKVHGTEVLRQLRQHPKTRALPVVMVSTSVEELAHLEETNHFGALAFIPKTFGQEDFLEKLRVLKNLPC